MTTTNNAISSARNKSALVVGATSSLAQVLCRKLAEQGYNLILAARDEQELSLLAGDIDTRFGNRCTTLLADIAEKSFNPTRFIEQAGAFDTLFMIIGDMGSGEQDDVQNLRHVALLNYVIPSQILSVAAETMHEQGGGNMVVIGSVAGDRGRASNYEYGAAKAAIATFTSGLRNRYAKLGLHIMTVKPGFVDTPMTWGMNSPLIASRETVSDAILKAMAKKKDVIYAPLFWKFIMLIIMHIPEKIFKKLKL